MASPRLTVKSIAKYLRGSKAVQAKILRDHKYPKREPQVHQPPFYQVAIGGVRQYYRSGNDAKVLAAAQNRALSINLKTKRQHNLRVLEAFAASQLAVRYFTPVKRTQFTGTVERLVIRLSADMQATESGTQRLIYFHCGREALHESTAQFIAQIAHWVMQQNHIELAPSQIEVMDLTNGRSYKARAWSDATGAELAAIAKAITKLWDQT